jgi:hypothetical protein
MSKWKRDSYVNRILAQSYFLNLKWRLHDVNLTARCLGSKSGRCGLMWRSRSLFRTVLELIGRNPGMFLAVRLDVWNRFRRYTSLMWLSCWCDVTCGRPERWQSLVLPDCLKCLNNDCIVLRWTPKCLATMFCANPAWSIPITWRRWFSVKRGITLKSMSFKQKCFFWFVGVNTILL